MINTLKHDVKIVAIFTAIAFFLLLFLLSLIAVTNNLFVSKKYYYTILKSATGLDVQPTISFRGFEIGRVSKYKLTRTNEIHVEFYIYKKFEEKFLENSILLKNINPISGEITSFELLVPEITKVEPQLKKEHTFVPEFSSDQAKEIISKGIVRTQDDGVTGIIRKINDILEQLKNSDTTEQINISMMKVNKVLDSLNNTIESYNTVSETDKTKKLTGIINHVGNTIQNVQKTVLYIKETLEVIHKNRKDLAPLIINTHKTLDKANNTLDGINNNPLIKGGIKKDEKDFVIEVTD